MKTAIALMLFSICTGLNLFGYLPQIIQLIKTKSADDINLASWLTWIFSEICYLSYILLESPEIGVISMATLSLTLMVITSVLTVHYQRRSKHNQTNKTQIKLITFDKGYVLFRPVNWDVLNKANFTNDEKYWLVREGLGRTSDWIKFQLKHGKTSKQIVSVLKKAYPAHAKLLNRVQPLLTNVISVDFTDNVKLARQLQKSEILVEIWSDNGLGGAKDKKYPDSDAGLEPELPAKHPLYKKYVSVHDELNVPGVYSRDINIKKENPKFFKTALARHKNIKPNEVIFIEDRPQNIESALSLGINCIQFIPKFCEREIVKGVPVAHTTNELIRELKKTGCLF